MPAMHFTVRWPDDSRENCYSPSTAIEKWFEIDKVYSVEEFTQLAQQALNEASERVAAKFGYYCSSAQDQSSAIQQKAKQFASTAPVVIEKIVPISH